MSASGMQVVDINDRMHWSLSQLSTAFGIARETVSKRLRKADVFASGKRKGNDVYHIGQAAKAIISAEAPTFEKIEDPDVLPPKDRLDWYKGENEKRKYLTDNGDLVLHEEVLVEMSSLVKICVHAIDSLPDLLEMKCSLGIEEIQVVEAVCDTARKELATKLAE